MTEPHSSANADRVIIFDTTLRDGEQCPGASMTFEEKLEVADILDALGVDVIEAGFPIASQGDFESVSEIARRVKNASVAGLSRASAKDIDRCAEAVRHARIPRIHTFISTSPVHMKYKLQMEPEKVLELIASSVTRARNHVEFVEWSAEDGTRTEHDFLCRAVETAINAGATTINIPDTVGYTTPDEYRALFEMVRVARAQFRQGDLFRPLPRRSGHGGRQFHRRRQRRRAADRVHDQRHRRARRQCGAGRNRHGDAHPRRRPAVHQQHRHQAADAGVKTGLGGHVLPGAI